MTKLPEPVLSAMCSAAVLFMEVMCFCALFPERASAKRRRLL